MSEPRRCPSCKQSDLVEGIGREEIQVGGHLFEAELAVRRCDSCGEVVIKLDDWGKFEREIAGWFARTGVLSGEVFRFMRKAAGLRAKELAELLDVTPETISRWEKEHRQPDRKAMMVLGDLVLDRLRGEETALNRLRALGKERQAEGSIDLTDSLRAA